MYADEPLPEGREKVTPTGEEGGRLLACYLFWLEHGGEDGADIEDVLGVSSADAWLEKAKPHVFLNPAAKLCVEKATIFLPKLRKGLNTAYKSDEDEDDSEAGEFGDLFDD